MISLLKSLGFISIQSMERFYWRCLMLAKLLYCPTLLSKHAMVTIFTDLHPSFVTQNHDTAEIWASCPQDGRIIIIDEETGSYRQLGTDQIYNAIPSHITISCDNRVIFLDCHQNRVFWVRKRNDFILIQRITFIGHHNKQLNGKITAMVAVTGQDSLGRILFSIGNGACLVRPAKAIGGQNHKHLMCNIL